LARHGLHSGGKAVDACAYVMRAVERVMFTKFFSLKKEFLFIYNYRLNGEFLNRERRIED